MQIEELFEWQGRACAICRSTEAVKWHVDHCHAKNFVRGILCQHCNLMLGLARDNVFTLVAAVKYLTQKGNADASS